MPLQTLTTTDISAVSNTAIVGTVTGSQLGAGSVETYMNNTGASYMFRNRIINGAMMIAQRGTSFSNPGNGTYVIDRFFLYSQGTAPASAAQVAGPTGFRNALQITGAPGNTVTALFQRIESYNCSDLSGTTITIQANISVSSAQTVAWYLQYANAQDNWSGNTPIANGTWSATTTATTFTATVTGLPSGVTNGLQLYFLPNNGGAFTSGTFTITGVQLEKGAVATPFENRPIGTELALCQRYFVVSNPTAPTGATNGSVGGIAYNTNGIGSPGIRFPAPMRVAPSISIWNNGTQNKVRITSTGAQATVTTFIIPASVLGAAFWYDSGGTPFTAGQSYDYDYQASAEL